MLFVLLAFFAGVITVFAPCVFALLPVIVGGSMTGDVHDKRRPVIIAASLAVSLLAFTLLLKVTTLFINVPPTTITAISGGIIIVLGIILLFPALYERFILSMNLQAKSQQMLGKGSGRGAITGAIITGAALGPVFSSCSPVYAYILASVLPANFGVAIIYMVAYIVGLSLMLLLVGYLGQKLVRRLKWASNPRGWFTRIVAVLFVVVGLMVISGYDKKFQTYISEHTPFDFDGLSAALIPTDDSGNKTVPDMATATSDAFNVQPYAAPEITGIESWINSQPLKIKDLKGKVVLIDFWTYSCINCIRTQPYLKDWYAKYHDSGFEIIGVHAPEFSFEKVKSNVEQAAKEAGLKYPIALDNNFATWQAYGNHYWPATYLIDKDGNVRRTHFGEGKYSEEEEAIRLLLSEKGGKMPQGAVTTKDDAASSRALTPETYLGAERMSNYVGSGYRSGTATYSLATLNAVNEWTLGGTWTVSDEGITAGKDAVLKYRVMAKDVYLVTGNNAAGSISVMLDGQPISVTGSAGADVKNSKLAVSMAQLYQLVHFSDYREDATIELHVPAGVQLNTFTFGG